MTHFDVENDLAIIVSRAVHVDPKAPRDYRAGVAGLMEGGELRFACEEMCSCLGDSDAGVRLRYDDLVHLFVLLKHVESKIYSLDQAFVIVLPEIYTKPLASREDVINDLLTQIVTLFAIEPAETDVLREEIFSLVEDGELERACHCLLNLFKDGRICFDFEGLARLFEILDFLTLQPFDKAAYLRPDGSGFYGSR